MSHWSVESRGELSRWPAAWPQTDWQTTGWTRVGGPKVWRHAHHAVRTSDWLLSLRFHLWLAEVAAICASEFSYNVSPRAGRRRAWQVLSSVWSLSLPNPSCACVELFAFAILIGLGLYIIIISYYRDKTNGLNVGGETNVTSSALSDDLMLECSSWTQSSQ